MIKEKIRRIVIPSLHHEQIETKGRKKERIDKIYSPN